MYCVGVALVASVSPERGLFSSPEHQTVGNAVKFDETLADGSNYSFDGSKLMTLKDNRGTLTYGDAILSCGDVYAGDWKNPICLGATDAEKESRFLTMFESLGEVGNDHPKSFAETLAATLTESFVKATLTNPIWLLYVTNNIDHFTKTAAIPEPPACGNWEAYTAGHAAALKAAQEATSLTGATDSLERALIMNACASHYLSDAFAAGHIRTPARELFYKGDDTHSSNLLDKDSGLLAMNMHDYDNRVGLKVANKRGEMWTSFGDSCYDIPESKENNDRQIKAHELSAREVFLAYKDSTKRAGMGLLTDLKVYDEVPLNAKATDLAWAKAQNNTAPMFLAEWDAVNSKTVVKRRTDLTDPNSWDFEEMKSENGDFLKAGLAKYMACSRCNDPTSCSVATGTHSKIALILGFAIGIPVLLCFVYCFWKSQCQTDVPDSSRPDTGGKPGSDYGEKPAPEPVKYGNTEASLTKHYAKN
jgi:hypothetical protein